MSRRADNWPHTRAAVLRFRTAVRVLCILVGIGIIRRALDPRHFPITTRYIRDDLASIRRSLELMDG